MVLWPLTVASRAGDCLLKLLGLFGLIGTILVTVNCRLRRNVRWLRCFFRFFINCFRVVAPLVGLVGLVGLG